MSFITEKLQKLSDFFQKRIMGIKTSEFIILIDITCELLQAQSQEPSYQENMHFKNIIRI